MLKDVPYGCQWGKICESAMVVALGCIGVVDLKTVLLQGVALGLKVVRQVGCVHLPSMLILMIDQSIALLLSSYLTASRLSHFKVLDHKIVIP